MRKVFYPGAVVIRKRYPDSPYKITKKSNINSSLGEINWEATSLVSNTGPWLINQKDEENYQLYEDYKVEKILTKYKL